MKRYAEVLRVPHVAALIASTLLARFPIGINALALILYLREQTGSYAVAGVVAGGLAAGAGVGAPVQGRLVDRLGQRRVLVPLAFIHAAALGGVVALTELGAPTVVLLACSTAAGFAIPPTSSVLRSMWPSLLRERQDLIPAAYALDSVLIELIFVLGPLLTAVIATLMSPAAALIVSAASVMIGTIAFTAQAPSRAILPDPEATAAAGRLRRALLAGGALARADVAARRHRDRDLRGHAARLQRGQQRLARAGGRAARGVVARQRRRRARLRRLDAPPAAAARAPRGDRPAPARAAAARGRVVDPGDGAARPPRGHVHRAAAGHPQRADRLGRPAGCPHRGLHLAVTAFVGGIAIGSAMAGAIVESSSWRVAFLVAAAAAAVGAVVALARRGTLVPPVAEPV